MEAATAAPAEPETIKPDETPADPKAERSPAETQSHDKLFRYSIYLHVGPGAEACEDGEKGTCNNEMHFHGWCRLPNQFQHNSIREKALAAKARKLRQLRDLESDSRVVLESEVEELVLAEARDSLIEELVGKEFVSDYQSAVRELTEGEEPEFEHLSEDQERFRALDSSPADDRDEEEYRELESRLDKFAERCQQVFEQNQKPLRDSLQDKTTEELGKLLIEDRIEREAALAFTSAYSQWEWYIGTLKPVEEGLPKDRVWSDFQLMLAAAPEVITALDQTFTALDAESGKALKNS